MKVKFSENNSGGDWWLNRAQYEALFSRGWRYEPSIYDIENHYDVASSARRDDVPYGWRDNVIGNFDSLRAAVESFEAATGEDFFAEGCPCCGAPFYMSSEGDSISGNVRRRPW